MSALHQAVARAIADAEDGHVPGARHKRAAAAAIRVVLAEATRSIEALPVERPRSLKRRAVIDLGDTLRALAALGEQELPLAYSMVVPEKIEAGSTISVVNGKIQIGDPQQIAQGKER